MRAKLVLTVIIMSVLIVSCQKEAIFDPNNPNGGGTTSGQSIIGNWKFIEFKAKTKSTGIANDPFLGNIKTITISDYTTVDNAGTLNIEASKLTATDLTYSVNSIAKVYMYEDNVLVDSVDFPFQTTMPPSTSTSTYKRVGTDSLYLNSGLFTNSSTGANTQTLGGGVKLKFDGNKMIWTSVYKNNSVQNINGVSVTKIDEATLTTTFQKL
jgi:hypothetical protein